MNRWPCVDFVKLTDEVRQPQCGPRKSSPSWEEDAPRAILKGLLQEWNLARNALQGMGILQ